MINPIRNHILSTNSISFLALLAFIAVKMILRAQIAIIMEHTIEIISAEILLIKVNESWKLNPHIHIISVSLRGIDAGVAIEIIIKNPPINGKIQEDSFILLI